MSRDGTIAGRIADLLDRLALYQRSRQQSDSLNPAQWEAMRYLGAANRYSCNPTALTDFLGTTKGTVSQTLIALERKKLVVRQPDSRDRRSIRIELTPGGRALLERDPMRAIADAAAGLPVAMQEKLATGLAVVLRELQHAGGRRAFGICSTCRFFGRDDAVGEPGGPHRCGLTLEPLADSDSRLICAEHEAAA